MSKKFPYPPCTVGPLSEKPRRHRFEIVTDEEGKPLLKVDPKTGATLYRVRCNQCGLNDPAKVLH